MSKRVLIIGGYGNFGSVITTMLALEGNIQVIIAGRSLQKAEQLAAELKARGGRYLKKSRSVLCQRTHVKYAFVQQPHRHYPITRLCEVLAIFTSGYQRYAYPTLHCSFLWFILT
ncbi:MAG: saccharopine dehydrogenase NADP-binding domain-containing protein [Xanthomonadales bacterium]|nr:saccharopine dehydrogenase NADP-binding domain-containing protein [Xanthomonadales bacterium]